ncbi:MAG: translational GTPase TypA [Alphaproteobacteria bacterium]
MTGALRNIAIIAHVDHGKTTLVDQLLRQSGTFRANQQVAERALDSNDLERERGITILAKCTSLTWSPGNHDGAPLRINIVDTPGHADFGGEVERILSMVDGVLLLVDAAEGPMPQTKFVTAKALALGLRPIVVINKTDRPDARPHEVHELVFDLFAALGASDEQLDFPLLFASGREGWAASDPEGPRENLGPLFASIAEQVPPPEASRAGCEDAPFAMLASLLEADPYLGRMLTGRIEQGTVRPNQVVRALNRDGEEVERSRVTKILAFRGLERTPVKEAGPGDIVALAGLTRATVADTIADAAVTAALSANPVDPPTLAVTFGINDSPFAGREGMKVQSRIIRERLFREAEGNVALRVRETTDTDSFEVAGRGELQLSVLIETMRREGFELSISRPRVLMKEDPESGRVLEPVEEIVVDVDEEHSGAVIEKISLRRGELRLLEHTGAGRMRLVFHCPTRGLIGYHGEFLTDTRGTGIMHRVFHDYAPHCGEIEDRRNGVLISNTQGTAVAYALFTLEERGSLFIPPGTEVYQGMIVGEHTRENDLDVNPLKTKQLTNIRAAGKDDAIRLTPPRQLGLEQALSYIADDELVEATPAAIRLRKKVLQPGLRKRRSGR